MTIVVLSFLWGPKAADPPLTLLPWPGQQEASFQRKELKCSLLGDQGWEAKLLCLARGCESRKQKKKAEKRQVCNNTPHPVILWFTQPPGQTRAWKPWAPWSCSRPAGKGRNSLVTHCPGIHTGESPGSAFPLSRSPISLALPLSSFLNFSESYRLRLILEIYVWVFSASPQNSVPLWGLESGIPKDTSGFELWHWGGEFILPSLRFFIFWEQMSVGVSTRL